MRPADVPELRGDASKATEALGWESEISFKELVRMMVRADVERYGKRVKKLTRTPIIIDGRHVFDQSHASGGRVQHFGWTILEQNGVRGLGFVYRGGRGS
jgi:hypothetical protein